MADLSGMSGDEFIEQLKRALGMADAGKTAGTRLDTKDIERFIESFKPLEKRISKAKDEMGGFTKGLLIGRKHIEDFDSEIKYLSKELEALNETGSETNDAMKRELIQRLEQIKSLQRSIQTVESFRSAVKGIAEVGVQGVKSMGSFAKSVQEGPSVIGQMSSLTQGVSDVAGAGLSKVTQGMSAAGSMMANSTNPRIKTLGVVAGVASSALGTLGGAALAAGKFAADFLIKELEKTIVTFQKASSAGATMADGMTGIRNAAYDSGLTVKQFGDVISSNAVTLAESGLGVGEAARRMGQVGKVLRQTNLSDGLLKLGYSFEEQASLTAEVMADFRKAGTLGKMSDAEIAKSTADYATNLRVIASVTGEDAKKKVEEARQATAQVAFRTKLQELEQKQPGITRKVMDAMATMPEIQRNAVMQMSTLGTVVDKNANVMMAQSGAFSNSITDFVGMLNSGSFSVAEYEKAQGKAADQFRKDIPNFYAIGMAGMAGALPELNTAISQMVRYTDRVSEQGFKDARAAAEGQKTATDELTQGFVDASKSAQQMAIDLEAIVLKDLKKFGKIMGDVFNEISGALEKFKAGMGDKSLSDKVLDLAGNVGMAAMALAGLPGVLSGAKSVLGKMGKGLSGVPGGATQQMDLFSDVAGGAGKAAGAAGKVNWGMAGKLSIGGILGGLALDAATEKLKESGYEKSAAATDIGSSALSGMGMGATIGSFIPVIGTAVGAGIGGVLGAGYGWYKNRGALSGTATEMAPASTGIANAQGQLVSDQTSAAAETKNAIRSVTTANQNIEKTVAELRAAIDTLVKQDPENKIVVKQILNALENVRDTIKDQVIRDEQLIRAIQDHKDVSERLLNNSY